MSRRRDLILIMVGLTLVACSKKTINTDDKAVDDTIQSREFLTDDDIRGALAGKSWKWSSPKNSGVTVYAADGTSLVEVTGKGTTSGTWSVENGRLCESFSPAPFMPKGVPKTCQPVSGNKTRLVVGNATFMPS